LVALFEVFVPSRSREKEGFCGPRRLRTLPNGFCFLDAFPGFLVSRPLCQGFVTSLNPCDPLPFPAPLARLYKSQYPHVQPNTSVPNLFFCRDVNYDPAFPLWVVLELVDLVAIKQNGCGLMFFLLFLVFSRGLGCFLSHFLLII